MSTALRLVTLARLIATGNTEIETLEALAKPLINEPVLVSQCLRAPHDINGNPRRVTVVYNAVTGDIWDAFDHGYSGPPDLSYIPDLPSIDVSVSEYKDFLKHGRTNAEYRAKRNR